MPETTQSLLNGMASCHRPELYANFAFSWRIASIHMGTDGVDVGSARLAGETGLLAGMLVIMKCRT
jgi:hypothetical protein